MAKGAGEVVVGDVIQHRLLAVFAVVAATVVIGTVNPVHAGATPAPPSTWVVNTTSDDSDANQNDGVCATSAGQCSLRAAIQSANKHAGRDLITFAIPGAGTQMIQLTKALPAIADTIGGLTIDGYTQPGATPNTDPLVSNAQIKVEVRGIGQVSGSASFVVTSPSNIFRGLALYNAYYDIKFKDDLADRNKVVGCFIGTNAAGTYGDSSAFTLGAGLWFYNGASENIVGTPSLADRNVISGNKTVGVKIEQFGSRHNVIQNNIIGLNPAGTNKLPNNAGFDLQWNSGSNVIGGTRAGEGNVISGNTYLGIDLSHSTISNQVLGNRIGTTPSGNSSASWSGNGDGLGLKDNAHNSLIVGNVIGGNKRHAIWSKHNFNEINTIVGNRIGVGLDGSAVGNASWGIWLTGHDHVIENNVIANNPGGGINVNNDLGGEANYPPALTERDRISANSFFNNGPMAIDIIPTGLNPNDPDDADTGVQGLLNHPTFLTVGVGQITGTSCAGCSVELYVADASGEGRQRIAAATADGGGAFSFTDAGIIGGRSFTALAIDPSGNTSEFAPAVSPGAAAAVAPTSISGSFFYQTVAGRQIAVTPDNGQSTSGPSGTTSKVVFDLNAPSAGTYALRAEVTAPSGSADSFWVQVDGQPSAGVLWDVAAGSALHSDDVNQRDGPDPYTVALAAGPHTVTLSMREDGTGVATMALAQLSAPPSGLTLTVPGDQTGTVGTPVSLAATGSDPDGGILSFTALGLPAGVTLDPLTGEFSGTPTTPGTSIVSVLLTDGPEWRQATFTWTVNGNAAPVITDPGDQIDGKGVAMSLPLAATDPDGDSMTFTAAGLPAGLSIASDGVVSGTPTTLGVTRVDLTVTDTAGNASILSFAWQITYAPFTCAVDRPTKTLSWTDQGATSYQIRHTVDGVETFLKTVNGATTTSIPKLYGTYRVTYTKNGVAYSTTCDGPALPPSQFACSIDVATSTLSWTDQGANSYSVKRIVNGVEQFVGTTSALSMVITMPTVTHTVTFSDSGTKYTTSCSP
jgi:CSLREA domain-containing protein